jgi:hypothetical protein
VRKFLFSSILAAVACVASGNVAQDHGRGVSGFGFLDKGPKAATPAASQGLNWRPTVELDPGPHPFRAETVHPITLFNNHTIGYRTLAQVEFLEVGVMVNGVFTTKTYGPDATGVYGGMQGVADETGLVYDGKRYYEPVAGRFIGADPHGPRRFHGPLFFLRR